MVLLIIIPIKWLFHWEYTLFSDKPTSYRNETIWFYSTILGNDASAGVCSAYDTTLLEQGASARDDPSLKGLSWQYHAISKPSWLVIADSIWQIIWIYIYYIYIYIYIDMCIYAESCPQWHDVPRVSHQLKYWRFHKIRQLNRPSAHQPISPWQELPESLEAQLLLQMRQLRGDTRAAEKRLSSSKAIRLDMSGHVETCRGPGRWFPGWMIVIYRYI